MKRPEINSGITFFYYPDLAAARSFYEEDLGFEVVDDQGWAVIYRIKGNCFFGIVDENKGFCEAKEKDAVLLTLVVEDTESWYEYAKSKGIEVESEPELKEDIGVKCFFLNDPEGYAIEIQEFTEEEKSKRFRPSELK